MSENITPTAPAISFKNQKVYIRSVNDIYVYKGEFDENTPLLDIVRGLKHVETIAVQEAQ